MIKLVNVVRYLVPMNAIFARLGIPADADTLAGITRLVSEQASESRHLDFKRQIHNADDLADDLSALANTGGGVLIIGVGTDSADRAATLHEQPLKAIEQQAVQAAREGIDEPLRIELAPVPGDDAPAMGFLVITVPPSDRAPHITVKRGRVLHRVGAHNKPMTRRELGAAFAAGGGLFAIEFGLTHGWDATSTSVVCLSARPFGCPQWGIKVANTGIVAAHDVNSTSLTSDIAWARDGVTLLERDPWSEKREPSPPYLPIRSLPPGSDVVLVCLRDLEDPSQDVLELTRQTPDGQVHRIEQSWSWMPRPRA